MPATVEQIIERARGRHWTFLDVQMPAGAIVQWMNERQRTVLLMVIDSAEELIGSSQEIETEGTATLIAHDDTGAPYFAETTEPGYALRFSGGVPYIDVGNTFISDPFGEFGDVPGLPLPADVLRFIEIVARDDNGNQEAPVVVMKQRNLDGQRSAGSGLRAFINANRLVPVRTSESDLWSKVTSVKLSLVVCPTLEALADELTLPDALIDVLVAMAAEFLATASPKCPEADKRRFEKQRGEAELRLQMTADEILSGIMKSSVVYRR